MLSLALKLSMRTLNMFARVPQRMLHVRDIEDALFLSPAYAGTGSTEQPGVSQVSSKKNLKTNDFGFWSWLFPSCVFIFKMPFTLMPPPFSIQLVILYSHGLLL